mmetsp:Transcript_10760/g.30228  ORF Transcript_10760/g.30228 Transcript_10760/m.30228 type:complete len:221 (+) Transcript_10760:2044-2706(+)
MFSLRPKATPRSNSSRRFASKKWKWLPTWIGRSHLDVTGRNTASRPTFRATAPSPTSTAPGGGPVAPLSSTSSKAERSGVGRNEPCSARLKSPSSAHTGSCTVTSFVPSRKVPSTCTLGSMAATPGCTCRCPSMRFPTAPSSATLSSPSRIISRSWLAMRASASGQESRSPRARRRWARNPAWLRASLSSSLGTSRMPPPSARARGSHPTHTAAQTPMGR